MAALLVFSALFGWAVGCNPQTGPLSQAVKYHFDVYPPVAWTYYNGTAIQNPKPKASLAEANTQVKKDITDAIISTIAEYGVSEAEIAISYPPLRIKRLEKGCSSCAKTPCSASDEIYDLYEETVFYTCIGNTTTPGYAVTEGTVTVTSPVLLYQSQWNSLAVMVQKKLSAKNVVFDEPVHQI